jgi:hypothetical protein
MNLQGIAAGFALVSVIFTTSGCLPQNTQSQGLMNQGRQPTQVASANTPCTPNAAADLVSTGRSLLELGTTLMQTKANMDSSRTGYSNYTMQDVENAQKIKQGQDVLNNVEAITGGPQAPCS